MKRQSGEDKDMKEGGRVLPYINWRMKCMTVAVVRGWKMEEGRGEGALYMFLVIAIIFIAIIFMRLFLCSCFIFKFMLFY